LLSIQIFINQKELDNALIYQNKASLLINTLNSSITKTAGILRANVSLKQYQAQTMAILKQKQSALITITEAITLFRQHFSVNTHTVIYARIILTKLGILSAMPNADNASIESELTGIKKLLETTLNSETPDYKALSIYLITIKFTQQLQTDNDLPLNNDWLELYQNSDYNIPDYSIISLMDSQ
ncbi:MAG: hypothetical protein KC484_11460, partial [Colwelliaceae bacterium]|nr:hypothetical protein [Colwelliaceae bacterium]